MDVSQPHEAKYQVSENMLQGGGFSPHPVSVNDISVSFER
jgi:hypothetical protein